jgi:hypothetical protein
MANVELTAVALSAVFGLCVPAVSLDKLPQTFSTKMVVPLTNEEKKRYAEAIGNDDRAFRIESDTGFVLMTVKGGFCRIITGEGNPESAAAEFRLRLKKAGGKEEQIVHHKSDSLEITGVIPLTNKDNVVVLFSAQKNSNSGFFASAFGVHRND